MNAVTEMTFSIIDEVESRSFVVAAHDKDIEETLAGIMFRGKRSDNDKWTYRAIIDGKTSEQKGSHVAAINDAITKGDRVSKNWNAAGVKVGAIFPTKEDNKVPPITEERAKEIVKLIPKMEKALEAEAKAEAKTREVRLKTAETVYAVRAECKTKEEWKTLQTHTPEGSPVRHLVSSKNDVGEMCTFAKVAQIAELFDTVPETKRSAKAVSMFIGSARNVAAAAIVKAIKEPPMVDGKPVYDVGELNTTNAAYNIMFDHVEGKDVFSGSDVADALLRTASVLIKLHADNWAASEGEDGTMPNLFDDEGKVVKREGSPIVGALIALEGSDEMANAISRALGRYTASTELAKADDVLDALSDATKTARESKKSIADYTHEEAAKLLLGILAGRIGDDADEAGQDLGGIVQILADYVKRVASGEVTVADIMSGDGDQTDDDAEDEADAV